MLNTSDHSGVVSFSICQSVCLKPLTPASLHIRLVDMQHVLVRQIEKRAEVVGLVKERIFTTSPCSITQTKVEECTFQGVLGLVGMLGSSVKVGLLKAFLVMMP